MRSLRIIYGFVIQDIMDRIPKGIPFALVLDGYSSGSGAEVKFIGVSVVTVTEKTAVGGASPVHCPAFTCHNLPLLSVGTPQLVRQDHLVDQIKIDAPHTAGVIETAVDSRVTQGTLAAVVTDSGSNYLKAARSLARFRV